LAPSDQQETALDRNHDESASCSEFPRPSQQPETVTPDGERSPEIENTGMCA